MQVASPSETCLHHALFTPLDRNVAPFALNHFVYRHVKQCAEVLQSYWGGIGGPTGLALTPQAPSSLLFLYPWVE